MENFFHRDGDGLGGGGADRNAGERDQGGERDWTTAAASLGAAVGATCPRWLIFVEGVGTASGEEVTDWLSAACQTVCR